MKGLILSLLVFVLYVGSTAVAAHGLRPRGHLRVFLLAFLPCGVGYFILYTVTPRDLCFLPPTWTEPVSVYKSFLLATRNLLELVPYRN